MRLVFILTLGCCLTAFGQAFTPRRPFIFATTTEIPFSPTNISGMSYWWNSDDLTNLLNQPINSWTDRVQQVVFTNALSSRPVYTNYGAYFNGTEYLTNRPGFSIQNNSSVFVALSHQANGNDRYAYLTWSQDSAAGWRAYTINGDPYVGTAGSGWSCWIGDAGAHNLLCTSAMPHNELLTLCTVRGLGAFTNGVASDPDGWPVDKFDTFGGNSPPLTTSGSFVGPIYEIIIYTNLITSTDVSNLHQYAQTWVIKGTVVVFTTQPTSIACLTNTIQSFTATANTGVQYQWRTNSVDLANGSHWSGVNTNVLWVTNDSTLFTNLSVDCVVTNLYWATTSSVAYLTVMDNAVTNGLVGWWKLNEGTGATFADSTPYNISGYLTNTFWATNGRNSEVTLGFTNATSGGNIADNNNYSISSAGMSVACFVRFNVLPPASSFQREWFLDKATLVANNAEWGITVNADSGDYGKICGHSWLLDSSKEQYQSSSTSVVTNLWYHMCITFPTNYIPASGTPHPNVYLNGALNETTPQGAPGGSGSIGNGTSPILVGCRSAGAETKFQGWLYDIRIYNRVLTTNDISLISIWRN